MPAGDMLGPQWFHGTPSGDLRGSHYGLHVGTRQAAADALNARIGEPLEGEWDGTRIYGKTLLKPYRMTGNEQINEPRYPSGKASYSDSTPVALDAIPEIVPLDIVGRMVNTPSSGIYGDFQANGRMAGQIKRGRAKSGYYYRNESEDEGSISAVVPGPAHVRRRDAGIPKQMRLF